MKNIPVFTACGGIATLFLKEIPATRRAYAILQTHTEGMESEQAAACAEFCRMAGAQEVYLSCRDGFALPLPHSHDMLLMTLPREMLRQPERPVTLEPLCSETEQFYIPQFNRRFSPVLNAALTSASVLEQAADNGSRHFLLRAEGAYIALGEVRGNELCAIASLSPGWGEDAAWALLAQTEGDPVTLSVCSANIRAMALYECMGFRQTEVLSKWYQA